MFTTYCVLCKILLFIKYLEDTQYFSFRSLVFHHSHLDLKSIWNILDFLHTQSGLQQINMNLFIPFN